MDDVPPGLGDRDLLLRITRDPHSLDDILVLTGFGLETPAGEPLRIRGADLNRLARCTRAIRRFGTAVRH
ncbi:MAG: hypothetical protein KDC87_08930, partial [Planctomycetes bacterium]|nr:hypothetical protein [Planctomycetota bacterium]